MFKGMPYERQFKARQINKTFSICVEVIKNEVNLKSRLNVPWNAIHRRRLKRIE